MTKEKKQINLKPAATRFSNALQSLAYRQSHWQVFTDFLDYTLILMRWWDVKEEMFDEIRGRYPEKEQHEKFVEAYVAMGDMADGDTVDRNGLDIGKRGFKDPFGDYFMEHFSSDRAGQFFTPEHLCDMMAIMNIGPEITDGMSVMDPTCGSGRCLLSAAKINRKLKFYGADVDLTCVKMTTINFMLNSMVGEVAHMNSLSLEHWGSYKTSLIPYGEYMLPMYVQLKPEQSTFSSRMKATYSEPILKPLPVFKKQPAASSVVQITLF